MKALMFAAGLALATVSVPAVAQDEYPLVADHWVDVGAIEIADGYGMKYAMFLADQWRANQEFAKSKGWIEGYEILINEFPREGEPDVYLLTRFKQFATVAEGEARNKAYREHMQRTNAQMEAESGDRAKYRTVQGSMLLRSYTFRD